MAMKSRKDTSTETPATEDRAQTKIWGNIGYTAKGAGPDGEDMFVSLPWGIPLDTMTKSAIKGGAFARKRQRAENALLESLLEAAFEGLEPGEADFITDLQFQIRRVGEDDPSEQQETDLEDARPKMNFLSK